jgi:hypothetical protein
MILLGIFMKDFWLVADWVEILFMENFVRIQYIEIFWSIG